MTKTLEIRVFDLLAELLTDALIVLRPFQTAGAITAGTLEALPDHLDHFLVLVQPYSHDLTPFPPLL